VVHIYTSSHVLELHKQQQRPIAYNIHQTAMYVARVSPRVSSTTVTHLSKIVTANLSSSLCGVRRDGGNLKGVEARQFSTTTRKGLREFFPKQETEMIRKTKPAWEHPGYAFSSHIHSTI
jgi:hypothetical protein